MSAINLPITRKTDAEPTRKVTCRTTPDEQVSTEDDAHPAGSLPAHLSRRATRRAREEMSESQRRGATDAPRPASSTAPTESPEVVQARAEGLPVRPRRVRPAHPRPDPRRDTPLIARAVSSVCPVTSCRGQRRGASGAGLTYLARHALTARLWATSTFKQCASADRLGPTPAEAPDEVNREIVREYAQAPRGTPPANTDTRRRSVHTAMRGRVERPDVIPGLRYRESPQ